MKVTQATYKKEVLVPTGDFSNIKVGVELTFSVGADFDRDLAWAEVNLHLDDELSAVKDELPLKEPKENMEGKEVEEKKTGVVKSPTPSIQRPLGEDFGACPECGNPLVKKTTKTGKEFLACSTNSWNKELQKPEGCLYTKWLNNVERPATPAQVAIIKDKWPGEYREGMTLSQASVLIKSKFKK